MRGAAREGEISNIAVLHGPISAANLRVTSLHSLGRRVQLETVGEKAPLRRDCIKVSFQLCL